MRSRLLNTAPAFAPNRDEHELVYGNAELEQIAGMHIDAIGAAIYLRNPQIDKIDQFFRKTAIFEDRRTPLRKP